MKTIIWMLYLALSAFCILDHFHTVALIESGAEELNPVVLWIIGNNKNWINLFYYKLTLVLFIGFMLFIYLKKVYPKSRRYYEKNYFNNNNNVTSIFNKRFSR